jgi:membrane protease YdiL (CAAX protease family)
MNARRVAALLEVLGVYVSGQYVVGLFATALRLQPVNPLVGITAQITDAELLIATRELLLLLTLQYAGWFLLIIPINWWHRRSGPAAYGLTRAGRPWAALVAAGIATAALAAWPETGVQLLDRVYDLGPTVPWRQAIFDTSWRRWEFWLFSGVISWAFVAFMEELFFRGYCQRRLAEDWGDGPAILGTACLFLFSHSQYLIANVYNVALMVSLLALAIGVGVVFAWTRSLIPCFVAHAIVNFPMTPVWQGLLLAAFVVGTVLLARRGAVVVKQVFAGASVLSSVALAALGAGYAIVSQRPGIVYVAAAMLGLAMGLEAMHRGQDRPTKAPAISLE